MSTETGPASKRLSSEGTSTETNTANLGQEQTQQQRHEHETPSAVQQSTADDPYTNPQTTPQATASTDQRDTPAIAATDVSSPHIESAAGTGDEDPPRQVIAVSASKSPAAFFNLARKFLVTNEMCDLSALEGAIVSAVDAAHLLERSQLATIVRIHTSYVSVEPKRKKQSSQQGDSDVLPVHRPQSQSVGLSIGGEVAAASTASDTSPSKTSRTQGLEARTPSSLPSPPGGSSSASAVTLHSSRRGSSSSRELRRARLVVTVRRTESYKRWLEENPLQAIMASETEE